MILDTLRLVTDWLNDGTNGVNAKIATTPRDGGDSAPTSLTAIVDETRNGAAARRKLPATVPALVVRLATAAPLDAEVGPNSDKRYGDIPLAIWYGDRDATSENGNRDAHYILRTVERVLRQLTNPANGAGLTAKVRNSVTLLFWKDWRYNTQDEPLEDGTIHGALFVTARVQDTVP